MALDDLVGGDDALLVVSGSELVGESIFANASEVGSRSSGENVLKIESDAGESWL